LPAPNGDAARTHSAETPSKTTFLCLDCRRHNHCTCFGEEGDQLNQMKNLSTKIGGAILTLAFIFGISAAAGTTAQAQDRRDRDYRQDRRTDPDDRWSNKP